MVKDSDQKQSARGGRAAQQQVIIHYTDGKGKMVYENGASYKGQWKAGKITRRSLSNTLWYIYLVPFK